MILSGKLITLPHLVPTIMSLYFPLLAGDVACDPVACSWVVERLDPAFLSSSSMSEDLDMPSFPVLLFARPLEAIAADEGTADCIEELPVPGVLVALVFLDEDDLLVGWVDDSLLVG